MDRKPLTSFIRARTLTTTVALCANLATIAAQAGEFVIQGDTVFDRTTELTWMRCSVGMRWAADQDRCVGVKEEMGFDEAQQIKTDEGWRVPRIGELKTLVKKRPQGQVKINTSAFPDMVGQTSTAYWSSTHSGASDGCCVYFNLGYSSNCYRSFTFAVRLVRGGQ